MPNYNYFGCSIDDVLARYTVGNPAAGGYAPTSDDFGGDAIIQTYMARVESVVVNAINPDFFRALVTPKRCCLVRRATAGQTEFNLPACLLPAVPLSISVWWGPPNIFQMEPRRRSDYGTSFGRENFTQGSAGAQGQSWRDGDVVSYELNINQFTCDPTTGAGQLLSPLGPMTQDDLVYASWATDTTNAAFGLSGPDGEQSLSSLAGIVADGVASIVGSLVYTQASGAWEHVGRLKEWYDTAIEGLKKSTTVIDEMRHLDWWKLMEKTDENSINSLRIFRQ